ncbi:hypothetical protein CN213_25725, partial [Sinorhizobium meliloti]
CHANLQIVLETFSHAQPASKYSLSNGAETALTRDLRGSCLMIFSLEFPCFVRCLRMVCVARDAVIGHIGIS